MDGTRVSPQRTRVQCGKGAVLVAADDRGFTCFLCEGTSGGVWYLRFDSPRRGDQVYVRLCQDCWRAVVAGVMRVQSES